MGEALNSLIKFQDLCLRLKETLLVGQITNIDNNAPLAVKNDLVPLKAYDSVASETSINIFVGLAENEI